MFPFGTRSHTGPAPTTTATSSSSSSSSSSGYGAIGTAPGGPSGVFSQSPFRRPTLLSFPLPLFPLPSSKSPRTFPLPLSPTPLALPASPLGNIWDTMAPFGTLPESTGFSFTSPFLAFRGVTSPGGGGGGGGMCSGSNGAPVGGSGGAKKGFSSPGSKSTSGSAGGVPRSHRAYGTTAALGSILRAPLTPLNYMCKMAPVLPLLLLLGLLPFTAVLSPSLSVSLPAHRSFPEYVRNLPYLPAKQRHDRGLRLTRGIPGLLGAPGGEETPTHDAQGGLGSAGKGDAQGLIPVPLKKAVDGELAAKVEEAGQDKGEEVPAKEVIMQVVVEKGSLDLEKGALNLDRVSSLDKDPLMVVTGGGGDALGLTGARQLEQQRKEGVHVRLHRKLGSMSEEDRSQKALV